MKNKESDDRSPTIRAMLISWNAGFRSRSNDDSWSGGPAAGLYLVTFDEIRVWTSWPQNELGEL
jgi:hypothetical protein